MPKRRKKALHFNLEFQDPFQSNKNVQYHSEHRSKRGRIYERDNSPKFLMYKKAKKTPIFDE